MNKDNFKIYTANCVSIGTRVYSYETHVADISDTFVTELGWWSQTTSKHVKRVANELGLTLKKYIRS